MKKTWLVLLLTLVMGLGVPLLYAYAYTLDGIYDWGGWLLTACFIGLPFLVWPGYLLWLTLWACKRIGGRWFLPPVFVLLLACTCGAWAGKLYQVFLVICGIMLALSVMIMILLPASEKNE